MTAMYYPFRLLSLSPMEEELSTVCRAAADAFEILSNLRPGFTRNVIPRINGSSELRGVSGERRGNLGERKCRSILDVASLEQFYSSSACHSLTELGGKTLVEDQQSQSGPLSRPKAALP